MLRDFLVINDPKLLPCLRVVCFRGCEYENHFSVPAVVELKRNGIKISDKDFAGYDPKTYGAFMYSSEVSELHKFESLFMVLDCGRASNLVITCRGDGEMRLLARSGQKSSLQSFDLQSKQTRSFEVEPTIGENDIYIDLRSTYSEKIGEKIIHSLDTSATLEAGKFLKFFEKEQSDGSKKVMEVKAERLEKHH